MFHFLANTDAALSALPGLGSVGVFSPIVLPAFLSFKGASCEYHEVVLYPLTKHFNFNLEHSL